MNRVIDINSYREKREKEQNKGNAINVNCYRKCKDNKKVIDMNAYREEKKKIPNICLTLKLNNDEAQILVDELSELIEAMHGEKITDAFLELLIKKEENSFIINKEEIINDALGSELYADSLLVLESQVDYLEELLIHTNDNYVLTELHLYEFHYLLPALASGIEVAEDDENIQKAIILQGILISCTELVAKHEKEFLSFYDKFKTNKEKLEALYQIL